MINQQEVRKHLLGMQEVLEERIEKLKKDVHHREEPLDPDFAEQVVQQENMDVQFALDGESRHELNLVNKALHRLDTDEYEACSRCGEAINPERLQALPYTDTCIGCAE